MSLQLPTNARKGDVMAILNKARIDLFDLTKDLSWVTAHDWDLSPNSRISFRKDKIPALKVAGLMKDPRDFGYGYHLSNERAAEYKAISRLLGEVLDYLDGYTLRPKQRIYTDTELSRFTVIEGGGQPSAICQFMLGGMSHA